MEFSRQEYWSGWPFLSPGYLPDPRIEPRSPTLQADSLPSSVQSISHVRLFVTLWTAAHQASLSIINSWSLLKLMSIKSVIPSNHLILCCPLFLLLLIFPNQTPLPHSRNWYMLQLFFGRLSSGDVRCSITWSVTPGHGVFF